MAAIARDANSLRVGGDVWRDQGRPALLGPMEDCPQALYALGYGANGITFGAVAARIVADICLGRPTDDARLFRLDRSS